MIKIIKKCIFLTILFASSKMAADTIDITRGNFDPVPIAINEFAGYNQNDVKNASKIVSVIKNDLKNSALFRPISSAAFIENKSGVAHKPLFASWQQINANLLLNGDVKILESGKLRIKFILWDAILETKLISETLEVPKKIWRRAAHKIADRIYKKITGYEGYFDSRIIYVSEKGPYTQRIKRIAIMDYDGENHQYLTDGSALVLTPRFSPDGKKILYLSYERKIPQVFMFDLLTGKSSLIGKFPGMSFAPRFSPDGKKALVSIAKDGNTHIHEIDLNTRKKTQLTDGVGIFTSPNYSPDGKKILFQSDKDGSKQLYIMNRNGSDMTKITNSAFYAEPVWSSSGYIAFTKISRNFGFTIGVMKPESISDNSERLIANGYLVESPAWSSNGRMIVFSKGTKPSKKKNSLSKLYMIDFTGNNERIIPTPHGASDPDWSKPR